MIIGKMPMPLAQFLKEHRRAEAEARKVADQESMIAQLKDKFAQQEKGMESLAVSLKQQQAQIQKVSAQVATTQDRPRIVDNNQ